MANNEAEIRISANVDSLKQEIKDANSNLKDLRTELKLNEAQFQNTGDKTAYLENKHEILSQMLEESEKKQAALNEQLELAKQCEDTEQIDKLTNSLNYAQIQGENLKAKLEDVNSQMEYNSSSTGQLSNTIEEQSAQLQELKNQYADAVLEYGKNSDEAKNLASEIKSLSGELSSNKDKMNEAKEGADQLDQSLEKTGDNGLGAMDTLAKGIIALGIADAVKEIGDTVMETAEMFEDSQAIIAQGTGATGEQLDSLNQSAREVYANMKNGNADMSDVSGVIAELNTRLGSTGPEVENLSNKVLAFSKVTGADAVDSVDSIADIMKRWKLDINDTDGLLDDLVTTNQSCSLSIDEITGYLTKNSTQFQELGYDLQDAQGFLISMADGGANVSSVMSGMQKAISNLSGKTKDVPGAFQSALEAIKNCDDVSSALNATVGNTGLTVEDVFGKRAAQEIATAVQNGGADIDEFKQKLVDNNGIMEQTAADSETMGDKYSQATNNLKETLSEQFLPVLVDITDLATQGINFLAEHQGIMTAIAVVIGLITTAIIAYNAVKGVQNVMDTLSTINLTALSAAELAALWPIALIVAAIAAVIAIIVVCIKHQDQIRAKVSEVSVAIKNRVTDLKDRTTEKINALKDNISRIVYNIKSVVIGVVNSIIGGVEHGVNKVIRGINRLITGINKIVGAAGSVIGLSVSIPLLSEVSLPRVALASGGLVTRPTTALVAEGGEPEAVMPVSVLRDYVQSAMSAVIRNVVIIDYALLAKAMAQQETVIEVDGRELGRIKKQA